MHRPFTSGSRQAPDPFDQFLEDNGFFRKHTARDSSCLFRVISEQMYDTQMHHSIVRKQCIWYMRAHPTIFAKQLDKDLDEYLDEMSKTRTYGTLMELQAASYLFKRNVLLFEPFNLGNYFTNSPQYKEIFRIFYSPERHFDSVFTSDFIKDAAICQSIFYEILYKDVFKLPDVNFAVEQMLHSQSLETAEYIKDENGYCTRVNLKDGRFFEFDLPDKTLCILANHKLCHFHYSKFPDFTEELCKDLKTLKRDENSDKRSFLPEKLISCVRQLLLEGITPFPYKVAKALDPNMYRNIEFDAWNEARKETKLQNLYIGDYNFKLIHFRQKIYRKIFQVGAKCHVKLRKSDSDLYTCHIQEIAIDKGYCVVFVEQLGEKRLVPYEYLQPLPADQFKPWVLPYRLQRHIYRGGSFRYTRQQYNYRLKWNEHCLTKESGYLSDLKDAEYFDCEENFKHKSRHPNDCFYKLKQYTHLENFETQTVEYCTMPVTVEPIPNEKTRENKTQQNENMSNPDLSASPQYPANESQQHDTEFDTNENNDSMPSEYPYFYPQIVYPEEFYGYGCDSNLPAGPPVTAALLPPNSGPIYYICNGAGYSPSFVQAPPPPTLGLTPPGAPTPMIAAGPNQFASYYPTQFYAPASLSAATAANESTVSKTISAPLFRRGEDLITSGRINYYVKKSIKFNGMDLPRDIPTLRYFFNLGLDYYKQKSANGLNESKLNIKAEKNINQGIQFDSEIPKTSTNSSSMSNANINYSSNKSHKRFSSRYFNSKERQNFQRGQQNRSNQNDYGTSKKGGEHRPSSSNGGCSSDGKTSNAYRIKDYFQNNEGGGKFANQFPEQGMPTCPTNIYNNIDSNGEELAQASTSYNSNQNVLSFVQDEPISRISLGPPHSAPGSGLYIPVALPPPAYGIYSAPPPPFPPQGVAGYSYITPNSAPTYYPAPNNSEGNTVAVEGNTEVADPQMGIPQQYSCMSYPPSQMQFFYSPPSGAPPVANSATIGSMPNNGYWRLPPPQQQQQQQPSSPQSNGAQYS